MKRIALISIGIPGSGKTTLLSPLADGYGLVRISRDDIRKEWFGDPLIQTDKDKATLEAHGRASQALALGKSVLKDSTFVERAKRKETIRVLKDAGAERIIGIVFATPLLTALERNRNREAVVAEDVIEMMYAQLETEPPTLEEGFDALYTDAQIDELEAIELKPLLN